MVYPLAGCEHKIQTHNDNMRCDFKLSKALRNTPLSLVPAGFVKLAVPLRAEPRAPLSVIALDIYMPSHEHVLETSDVSLCFNGAEGFAKHSGVGMLQLGMRVCNQLPTVHAAGDSAGYHEQTKRVLCSLER